MKSKIPSVDKNGWVQGSELDRIFKIVSAQGKHHATNLRKRFMAMVVGSKLHNPKVRDGNTMTPHEMDEQLSGMQKSFSILASKALGNTHSKQTKVLASLKDFQEKFNNDTFLGDLSQTILASRGEGNDALEAKSILAGLVKTMIYVYVMADSRWSEFFQTINLANDEQPVIEYGTGKQKLRVSYLGTDGGLRTVQPEAQGGIFRHFIQLLEIATDDYEYPIRDLNKGDIRQGMISLVDHAMALADAIDAMLASLIQVSGMPASPFVTTFTTNNASEHLNHFLLDPRVNVANLPTGNFIALASNTGTSTIRTEVLDAVIKYQGMWGSSTVNGAAPLQVEAVHIASADAFGFLGQAGVSSQVNFLTDQIFRQGRVAEYAGQQFNWVTDNTIDPAQGICYVRFNQPVGRLYRKPGMDQVFHDTSIGLQKVNKERMSATAVLGTAMILQDHRNVLAIKYRS